MNIRNKNAQEFIDKVDREASRLSVNLVFGRGKSIIAGADRGRAGGMFIPPDEENAGTLAVACGVPSAEWLHTLAHEYTHMQQWFREHPAWLAWDAKDTPKNYYNLEVITEKQSCKLIEKYELPCGAHIARTDKYLQDLRKSLDL